MQKIDDLFNNEWKKSCNFKQYCLATLVCNRNIDIMDALSQVK